MIGRTAHGFFSVSPSSVDARLHVLESPNEPKRSIVKAVPVERIANHIREVRGEKVLLDSDLAELYEVETKALNQAVQRNIERFPADFMFQLTGEEAGILKSQSVTSSSHGGRRTLPYAFTEQGVAMLSSVLRSDRAVQVNVAIMRAFVAMRTLISSHKSLAEKIAELETRYDGQFQQVFSVLREMIEDDQQKKRKPPIGFHTEAGLHRTKSKGKGRAR